MARGWESKSVADQIEEGNQGVETRNPSRFTAEDRERRAKLESLRLSRSRLLQQLEKAKHSAHREMLLKGLEALQREMDAVSGKAETANSSGITSGSDQSGS